MRFFSRDLLSMLRAMSENIAQYTQLIKTKAWLAIEKKELEIKIDQLPKDRRGIIRQRLEALGKVDRNANFFVSYCLPFPFLCPSKNSPSYINIPS